MSERWHERLQAESAAWVRQGLIDATQRDSILKLYPLGEGDRRDRTVMILSLLGSLLVGAGVILYVAANWPRIPAMAKVIGILVAMLVSYGTGFYFQFRGGSPRLGQGLIFLGGLIYGAGVWLIAQTFHLSSDFPTGFLLWGGGIIPVVWAVGSRPLLYLATGLLTIWTVGAQSELNQINPLYPILMLGAVLPLARRTESRLPEVAVLLGLFLWYGINVSRPLEVQASIWVLQVVGRQAVLYGTVLLVAGIARMGKALTYLASGGIVTLLGLYFLTFPGPTWFPQTTERHLPGFFAGQAFAAGGTVVLLALLAIAAALAMRRGMGAQRWFLPTLFVPVVAVLVTPWLPEVPRLILFNLLLLGGSLTMVVLGIQRRLEGLLNLGLLAFSLHLITRYFDLFFSAMNRSLFFILGGLLLLAGGWYLERSRRRWVGDWEGGTGDEE